MRYFGSATSSLHVMRFVIAIALLVGTVFSVAAAPALASTVELDLRTYEPPKSATVTSLVAVWTAAPGEANQLTVEIDDRGVVLLRDSAAPISAGDGCRAQPDGSVACDASRYSPPSLELDGGDRDDTIRVSADRPVQASVTAGDGDDRVTTAGAGLQVDGDAGDDVVVGGEFIDRLAGGPGADDLRGNGGDDTLIGDRAPSGALEGIDEPPTADRLDGGPGRDLVSYAARSTAVTVDLTTGSGGPPDEHDALIGVEDLTGGGGSDALIGDDTTNRIDGGFGGGGDTIDGRGGNDRIRLTDNTTDSIAHIDGGPGDDELGVFAHAVLDGGPGDDYLWGIVAGPMRCGPGHDRVEPREDAVVARDCERTDTWLFTLTEFQITTTRATVIVRADGYPRRELCGIELLARGLGGRVLARGTTRVPDRRRRRVTLRLSTPPPAHVRIAIGALSCDRRHPNGKPPPAADRETFTREASVKPGTV